MNKNDKNAVSLTKQDYYFENGLMVFAKQYHLKRGFCCKNECRHCPYGEKPSKGFKPMEG